MSTHRLKPKTVGFFGGSFNPPHLGHTLAAVFAKSRFELDEVWWAPIVNHAFGKSLLPFKDRVAMCRMAISGLGQGFKVSPIENKVQTEGKSLLTLRALAQTYPHIRFKLIVGSDAWSERKKWFQFSSIEKEFGALVVPRLNHLTGNTFAIPDISSTYIRSHPRSKITQSWVTPKVLAYYRELTQT